jgi:hypothetical protein
MAAGDAGGDAESITLEDAGPYGDARTESDAADAHDESESEAEGPDSTCQTDAHPEDASPSCDH